MDQPQDAAPKSADPTLQIPPSDRQIEDAADSGSSSVLPKIEDGGSSPVRENRNRFQTRRWHLVLENQTDSPVTDVDFHYENTDGTPVSDFDVLAGKHNRTEVLGPYESVKFPLIQAFGSPSSAICVVEWSDKEGVRHSTRATVRIP